MRIENFKAAAFTLMLQRQFLLGALLPPLEELRTDPARAYKLQPLVGAPPMPSVDPKALAFLFESEDGELLNRLVMAETVYRGVIALVTARNEAHFKFQAKVETAHEGSAEDKIDLEDLHRFAGKALAAQLEHLTNALYRSMDTAIRFNREVYEESHVVFSRRFRFHRPKLFRIEDVPMPGETTGGRSVG